jgi:hypothetical protein
VRTVLGTVNYREHAPARNESYEHTDDTGDRGNPKHFCNNSAETDVIAKRVAPRQFRNCRIAK